MIEERPPLPDASAFGATGKGDPQLPAHAPATYYDIPLLKRPHWEWEVMVYLFLGGVMGGSGILAAIADDRPEHDEDLARSARYLAFALAAACPVILIKHLGRPERFLHMLRIVKTKSVMSMGVWGLIAFSGPAALAAAGQASRDGKLPGWIASLAPRAVTNPAQALLGAFIAGYTGVLISATAIPVWGKGKRHIPAFSVCSGLAGACAANAAILALTGGSKRTQQKLEKLELIAAAAELGLLEAFRVYAGSTGKPMFEGARGRRLLNRTEVGGIVVPAALAALPFHHPLKTLVSSALTLIGGYTLRETLIEAGKDSADDPREASLQPE